MTEQIALWDPTLDLPFRPSRGLGGQDAIPFRVKNVSDMMTATTVTGSLSPDIAGRYELSTDGTTWESALTVASLAPGEISAVQYIHATGVGNTILSVLYGALFTITVGSWS